MNNLKKILPLLLSIFSFLANAQRERILFNFDWQFSYDKISWRNVNLPHDYLIEQPWVAPSADEKAEMNNEAANIKSRLSARAFKELNNGYYKKTFVPDESWRNRRVLIDFEGIMLVGDAYLNGELIGKTDYGYLGFECDITDKLKWGKENTIEVSAYPQNPKSSRWYTGGGLYRDVNIILTNKEVFFTRHPLQITTSLDNSFLTKKSDHKVSAAASPVQVYLLAEVSNLSKRKIDSLTFSVSITDAAGTVVASKILKKKYYARQRTNEYRLDSLAIVSPVLWDLDNPHLYTAHIAVLDNSGKPYDEWQEQFGLRTIEYGADYGFKLNGKKVLLKGLANHHTLGALGAAAHEKAIEKRIKMLKQFGFNHIRTSHNPYSESFLRLCDKYGILVVDELYDKWLKQFCGDRVSWTEQWQHDISEWIRRDRNHPSVVMWSLGNELQQEWGMTYADWGVTNFRLQKTLLNRYDTTRPVTVAMHPRFRDVDTDSLPAPLVHETDIAAYNYRYMYFPGDSRRFPWMKFYQSEANTQGLGKNFFEMDLDKVVGLAYWGAIDYLGESMGWPRKGWTLGEFDITLQPKPTAYFIKSYFVDDEPLVHLSVLKGAAANEWNGVVQGTMELTENWSGGATPVTLTAFSNADEVELKINGKSMGRLSNDRAHADKRNKFVFTNIAYEPGKAEAIAYNNGKPVATHAIETPEKLSALLIETDNSEWKSDGLDLQHVRIFAVDKKGRRIYNEKELFSVTIEGNAEIAALSNGDMTCDYLNVPLSTDKKTAEYPLHDGAAMIILRSQKASSLSDKAKTVKLTVNYGNKIKVTRKIELKF
ncbi:MAG: DUF4982 domain-containing protein [Bacteroidaceae bacterium]|nr:DUF4982 domain-containing protein [Bacteroidaceae bacterium]